MKKLLLAFLCSLALTACRHEIAPLEKGLVVDGGALGGMTAKGSSSWQLSKRQLDHCSEWLKSHESGWEMIFASPPFPTYSVLLTHSDGARTQIDMFSVNDSWRRTVHIYSNDKNGKFIFAGTQQVAESDIAALKASLLYKQ